jgi:hypothetical protein
MHSFWARGAHGPYFWICPSALERLFWDCEQTSVLFAFICIHFYFPFCHTFWQTNLGNVTGTRYLKCRNIVVKVNVHYSRHQSYRERFVGWIENSMEAFLGSVF